MRLCLTLCSLLLMCLALGNADESKIFCNYRSWAVKKVGYTKMAVTDIDPSLCTHLIYSLVGITENGNVSVLYPRIDLPENRSSTGFQKFNALRKQNETLKTLVSGGDVARAYGNYLKVIADTSLRSKYVKNVVDFVLRHKFDGFDVFWQSTNIPVVDPVVENLVLLLKEFRTSFDEHKLILSISVHGTEQLASSYYDIPEVSKYVDFILLDVLCHSSTDPIAGHSAPLYFASRETSNLDLTLNINASVHYWLAQGAPAEKLILGTRFQGMSYILKDSAEHLPGSPVSGPARLSDLSQGYISYSGICQQISQDGWTTVWDKEQRVPYAYAGNEWISYDNVRSLKEKAKYVQSLGLGGVVALYIDMDDHRGKCGDRFPLLKALNRGLREIGSSPIEEQDDDPTSDADVIKGSDQNAERTCAKYNHKYVRDQQNCAKFWICQKIDENEFRAEPFSCGQDLYFDTIHKICKTKHLVQCS